MWLLGRVLGHAARAKAITANPVPDVQLPTDRSVGRLPHEPYFLTAQQIEDVALRLDTAHPYGLLVRFTAWTGMRAGEVAGLNVSDLDLLRSKVTVRRTRRKVHGDWEEHTPKSGKARAMPLMPWLAEDMAAYLAQHPRANEPYAPLWPGARQGSTDSGGVDYGKPWEALTFYRRRYLPAVRAAGLPTGQPNGVTFHSLRHTFASLAASRGVPRGRSQVGWGTRPRSSPSPSTRTCSPHTPPQRSMRWPLAVVQRPAQRLTTWSLSEPVDVVHVYS